MTGYCYRSDNVIIFGLAQSDHIKRHLLYNDNVFYSNKTISFTIAMHLYHQGRGDFIRPRAVLIFFDISGHTVRSTTTKHYKIK